MSAPMEVGKSDTGMISWPHMPTRSLGATESDSEAALDVWPPKTESRARIFFLESTFQDPCPALNGTRRVTMPQVLTRRSEPIHPSSQARSPAPTNPKTGSGSDHPGGRSPQSLLNLTLTALCGPWSNCRLRLLLHWQLQPPSQPAGPGAHGPGVTQACHCGGSSLATFESADDLGRLRVGRPRSKSSERFVGGRSE